MAYLGRGIENLSDRVVLDSLTASATASYTLQLNSVNFVPSSAESLTVSLNGVIQAPISSYTVSGSSIVFASSLSASDSIDFIIAERGITLQTPSAGSVGTSQLASSAVTTAKIADDAVTFDKLSGQNYPAWFVNLSADQTSISEQTNTKIQFNTEVIDTDNAYDNSTNYRWTCPSGKAGKYKVELSLLLRTQSDNVSNLARCKCLIYKNGSEVAETFNDFRNNYARKNHCNQSLILDIAEGDYLEGFGFGHSVDAGGIQFMGDSAYESWFLGYRIGD